MSKYFRAGAVGVGVATLIAGVLLLRSRPEGTSRPAALDREEEEEARESGLRPTENAMEEGDEERNHEARARWIEQLHRAPPGVDYRAVERANGLAQTRRRAALRVAPPAPAEGTWVERGSNNQAGRMQVARLSADGETLYAGSALGGVWKGRPDGSDWEPIGDNLYGGVAWLEVLPGEAEGPDVLVVANDGGLIHRSTDGGATWTEPEGVGNVSWTRRLLKLEDGSETLYLLGFGSRTAKLYRSTDKGASFEAIYDVGGYYGDLWAPRDGGTALFLAASDGVYRSDDLGDTWTLLSTFDSDAYEAEITGSEAGAPRLWIILGARDLYRSDDGGLSWTSLGRLDDYYGTLNASILDVDLFSYGGVDLYVTDDGGATFDRVNSWADYYGNPAELLHADMFGLDVTLTADGEELWHVGTDGGVYRSETGLRSVENLSLFGLRVSQYYSTLTSKADPEHIIAGAQDQGYQITAGVEQDDGLLEFDQATSGDWGHLTSGDGTHDYVYSVYPGYVLATTGETNPRMTYGDFPSRESYVPWLPPIVADPDELTVFYFPATRLYKYTYSSRRGSLSYEQHSDQAFDDRSDEYISALAFSPNDHQRMYAATSYGRFFVSADKGITWDLSEGTVADDNWYYGQDILASRFDDGVVYVGGSGYGTPGVQRSTDGGLSFSDWADGLPDTLVYCLCEAPDGSGRIFAGTETSVYSRDRDGAAWTDVTDTAAPVTIYWSCESLSAENTIRFATYGRGIWDLQLADSEDGCFPVEDADADGVDCLDDCDDGAADALPGGEEICGDGVDQDCDGADLACDAGEGEGEGEGEGDKGGGCGCASGGGAGAWGLLVGVGLGLGRRRQQQVGGGNNRCQVDTVLLSPITRVIKAECHAPLDSTSPALATTS